MKRTRPRLAPQVFQSSQLDCGPAALRCLLMGHGISAPLEQLRAYCRTQADGTSIDDLEDTANAHGLPVEQFILPKESIFELAGTLSPCLVVIQDPSGLPHFVVLWGRIGGLLQLMDPASGRRFVRREEFESSLYLHHHAIAPRQTVQFVARAPMRDWLLGSFAAFGLRAEAEREIESSIGKKDAERLAWLPAVARTLARLRRARQLRPGEASQMFQRLMELPAAAGQAATEVVAIHDLFITPGRFANRPLGGRMMVNGAVVLALPPGQRARPVPPPTAVRPDAAAPPVGVEPEPSRPDHARARVPDDVGVWRRIWELMGPEGRADSRLLVALSLLSAGTTLVEALLFRASWELPQLLAVARQRLWAALVIAGFLLIVLCINVAAGVIARRLGRVLEARLRTEVLYRVPRIEPEYFQTRTTSDLTSRAHMLHEVGQIPGAVIALMLLVFDAAITIVAVSIINWWAGLVVGAGILVCVATSLVLFQAISRFERAKQSLQADLDTTQLEVMLGAMPIRAHRAFANFRADHESKLVQWLDAALRHASASTAILASAAGVTTAGVIAAVAIYVLSSAEREGLLLLLFWIQRFPTLTIALVQTLRTLPSLRHRMERMLEVLQAPFAAKEWEGGGASEGPAAGCAIRLQGVTALGHGLPRVSDLELTLANGEHVAVVGRSGSGKSSFISLLNGALTPTSGRVEVDGRELDELELQRLRQQTAWIDPAVQLWDASLLENILYGNELRTRRGMADIVDGSELRGVIAQLPHGAQSRIGEEGRVLSGGQAQRVRVGRALCPENSRLVLLDEAFRGLDRDQRRRMIERCRAIWASSTLLCVTHDVRDTLPFERVLVFEGGRIVEDGHPRTLMQTAGSVYRKLALADQAASDRIQDPERWTTWRVTDGELATSAGALDDVH